MTTPLHGAHFGTELASGMKVVRLTSLVRIVFPVLYITSIPKRAIGFSFERGPFGLLSGSLLFAGSILVAFALSPALGLISLPLALWLLGGTSIVMMYNSTAASIAFVKPLCSSCRLLPIIEEHEAIHLAGVGDDRAIWSEMRRRYSCESLSLIGDPKVCTFCPIPKRLKEH